MKIITEFINRDWSRGEKFLIATSFLLFGVIIGFMISPIKEGIYCGNDNGNNYICDEECEK